MSIDVDILKTARENLPGHWFQGDFSDGQGNFCALGHLGYALGVADGNIDEFTDGRDMEYAVLLAELIKEQYPDFNPKGYNGSVAEWNDSEDRTEEEVIAIFDKAIARAEEML